jgi:hypothetical protein
MYLQQTKSYKQKNFEKKTLFFVGILSATDETSRFRSLSLVLLSELYELNIHRATLPLIALKLKISLYCPCKSLTSRNAHFKLHILCCRWGPGCWASFFSWSAARPSFKSFRASGWPEHSPPPTIQHHHSPAQNTNKSRPILTEALSVLDALKLGCTLIKCTRLESTPHRKYSATEALPSLSLGCTPRRIHFDEMHSARMHSSASDALGLEFTPPWKNSASVALRNRYISPRMHSTSCTTIPSNSMISYCAHSQLT